MTSLQTILENDKERFLQNASGANSRQEVIKVCEDELGRVLYKYNEEEGSDRVKEEAARLIKAVKPALGLTDTEGETKIYRRSQIGRAAGAKRSKLFPVLLGAGIVCLFAAAVLLYAANQAYPKNIYPILCLVGAGGAALFFAGRKMNASASGAEDDISAETMSDVTRIYRTLLMVMVTADQILDEVRSAESIEQRKERQETRGGFDDKTVAMFSRILEEAYGDRENNVTGTILADLKFFLHSKGIEAVDYTAEHKNWFDRMPGTKEETLRPALVMDDILLKKGLASGGR